MIKSAVQLTFPCPACGRFVTLRTFRATGPCPSCGTCLEVNLYVQPTAPAESDPLGTAPAAGGAGKRFDERRFRPAAQPPGPD